MPPGAIKQWHQSADDNPPGPEKGKVAVRHRRIFSQGFEEITDRAGEMQSKCILREKSAGSDLPTVEEL